MRKQIACLRLLTLSAGLFLWTALQAQTRTVTGTVTRADDGQPLSGVSIIVKGKATGTQTGADGGYAIAAAPADVLVFSYLGFLDQERTVGNNSTVNVSMGLAESKMDEVVVVGYGTQNRRALSGAVATVDVAAREDVPRNNVGTVLQGVAGVRVQSGTGNPGTSPTIVIRGGTDFGGGGTPLFVVDGAIVPSLYGLNMQDVESIDILKDASSTAIYGARGSDGVVLITTKRGKRGRSQVSYTYRRANNYKRTAKTSYLTAEEYLIWNRRGIGSRYAAALADNNAGQRNTSTGAITGPWGWSVNPANKAANGVYSTQLLGNDNRHLLSDPKYSLLVDKNPFDPTKTDSILYIANDPRDLEDLILQNSHLNEHYVNFSGANEMGNFSLGLGALNDVGIVIGSALDRMNLNFNGGLNVNKDLTVGMNINAYAVTATPSYLNADVGDGVGGLIQRFGGIAPTVRLYDDVTGEVLPGDAGSYLGNPLYYKDKFINKSIQQRYSGGVNLAYQFIPHLKFTGSASGYFLYTTGESFNKAKRIGTFGGLDTARFASFSNARESQYTYNGFLNYDRSFGDHDINVMVGGEYYERRINNYSATARGAATDAIPYLTASVRPEGTPSSSFNFWDRMASGIGRINYAFQDKYFATFNLRYDGTSRLANNKYGLFPGVSAAWNLHNEDFFAKSFLANYISTIKPRISYGQNGKVASVGVFATDPAYGDLGIYNGNAAYGPPTGSLTNIDLRWERVTSLNFGLDLGLLNNRVTVIGDYFIRDVFDKITGQSLPAWVGVGSVQTNLGQLRNKGIELELRANILRPTSANGLRWDFNVSYYNVKNYAVDLPDNGLERNRQGGAIQVYDPKSKELIWVAGLQEGRRIGLDEVWAPVWDGIYTSQEQIEKDKEIANTYYSSQITNKKLKLLGDARWKDINGDNIIDFQDRVYIGRTTPQHMGSFSNRFAWKGLELFASFDYATGFVAFNQVKARGLAQNQGSQNSTVDVKNTWHPENPTGTLPRFYWAYGISSATTFSAGNFWEKADYLAFREISLSYNVNKNILESAFKNRIKGLSVFVTGTNLAYITDYSGTMPEEGSNDQGRFPFPKTVTFGANIKL